MDSKSQEGIPFRSTDIDWHLKAEVYAAIRFMRSYNLFCHFGFAFRCNAEVEILAVRKNENIKTPDRKHIATMLLGIIVCGISLSSSLSTKHGKRILYSLFSVLSQPMKTIYLCIFFYRYLQSDQNEKNKKTKSFPYFE